MIGSRLREPTAWRERLGFLLVPLLDAQDAERFVLLNGSKGNFCLDIATTTFDDPRRLAWSADTGHYVSVQESRVRVWRWDRYAPTLYTPEKVWENLERFQQILEADQPPRDRSIVAHFIRAYRSLRNALSGTNQSSKSLSAYLSLLNRADGRFFQSGSSSKGNSPAYISEGDQLLSSMPGGVVDEILDELLNRRTIDGHTPLLPVVLRHASGRLFQEAHYLVESSLQSTLFAPDPVRIHGKGSSTGAYFTPTSLVRAVVEQSFSAKSLPTDSITIFDPACGSAEFLREAVRYLSLLGYKGKVRLIGWDLSSAACSMAHFTLSCEGRNYSSDIEIDVRLMDSISEPWPQNVDFIMMNPPYQAWQDMPHERRQQVSGILGEMKKGRPDLAAVFLLKAVGSLAIHGVVGAVLPASVFDGDYASLLRDHIETQLTPVCLARLGNLLIFQDVIVDTGIFIGAKKDHAHPSRPPIILWADHESNSSDRAFRALRRANAQASLEIEPIHTKNFSVYVGRAFDSKTRDWAPRPYAAYELLHRLRDFPRVRDLFAVRQGSRTGLNAAFVLDRAELLRLPKREQRFFRPAVVNDSINDGRLNDDTFVFFPYGGDLPKIEQEDQLKRELGKYYSTHLFKYRETLTGRAGIKTNRWWDLTRPRGWQILRKPKLVSKYFGKQGAFAIDTTGNFVVVQGFAWVHRASRRASSDIELNYAYLAILNSEIIELLLSGVSNNVAGGQWNLSSKFIEEMPFPDLTTQPNEIVSILGTFGADLTTGGQVDQKALSKLVRTIFRIGEE